MNSQPKIVKILTPPPISPGNLIASSSMQNVAQNALTVQMTRSDPSAAMRSVPQKTTLTTTHPAQPLLAYLVTPDLPDKKAGFPTNIVVQHLKTKQIMWTMSVGELAASLFDLDVLSRHSVPRQNKAVKDLGQVYRLDFFDQSTLYWSGFSGESATSATSQSSLSPGASTASPKRWQYLFVQFTSRILVVNLRTGPSQVSGTRSALQTGSNAQIVARISQESVGVVISSNAVPIAMHVVLVGTVDGSISAYDWKKGKAVKIFKLCNKNDYVCHICATNPFPNQQASTSPLNGSTSTTKSVSATKGTHKKRVVAMTKKGVAYVVELQIDSAGETVKEIMAPKARLDGGAVPVSVYKWDEEASSLEHIFCRYDPLRDLFMWCYPSKTKAKLMLWDLGQLPAPDSRQRKKGEPARPEPSLVMQFPYETSHTIFPGWTHESTPMDSIMCVAVTKEGDFQMLMAPLHNSGSTMKNPFAAYTIHSVHLAQILQRDLHGADELPSIRVQSVMCPYLRDSSIFFIGTNVGILMLQMKDGNLVSFPGSTHAHLTANVGSMGRSMITARNSEILYGALDSAFEANAVNPVGPMVARNPLVVYESPPPLHLPPEIHKRPVRLPPSFLPSPSRNYICCFWKEEMRYEILHVPTLFQKVSSRTDSLLGASPVIASGTGVSSIAWIGDDDVFALLYNPEQDLALKVGIDLSAPTLSLGKELASAASKITDIKRLRDLSKLKELASMKAVKSSANAVVGTASKLKSLEGLREIANTASKATVGTVRGTVKGATKVTVGTAKLTSKVAVGTVRGTVKGTAKVAVGTMRGAKVTMGTGKSRGKFGGDGAGKGVGSAGKAGKVTIGGAASIASFGLLGKRRQQAQQQAQTSLAQARSEDDDDNGQQGKAAALSAQSMMAPGNLDGTTTEKGSSEKMERKHPWVEIRALIGAAENGADLAATTVSNLGELPLRTGNRNPPTIVFGGPVLCVASKVDDDDEGLAYFYTRKRGQEGDRADSYISSGPAFPCPDVVAWDEDGRLCAVAIQTQIAFYLSEESEFVFLGTARLGSPADLDAQVVSVSFVHGTVFCTTRSAVYCVFLGDLDGGVCCIDTYKLASTEVDALPVSATRNEHSSLTPVTLPMPLACPVVMGYQSGSLLVSTISGVQAIPLDHPILRIGGLIAAGHHARAERWFEAVPPSGHEALACFLERRGVPEMCLALSGLSLETTIDMCMRLGYVDRLEEAVDLYGLEGIRSVDMGRGVSCNTFGQEDHAVSLVISVGAYLLAHGKVELVRRLASECLSSGESGRRDGLMLAGLLLSLADGNDSRKVIQRAVDGPIDRIVEGMVGAQTDDWLVGQYVRDHVLAKDSIGRSR